MAPVASFELPSVIGVELARAVSDEIIFLRFEPGARLTEEELCARYGVSRSPVREAFQQLEADGLIVRIARRGARVAPMNPQNLAEVYACRTVLEGLAAAQAAEAAHPDMVSRLNEHVAGMAGALAANDVAAFFTHNVALTRGIHEASGSATLMKLVAGIEKQALRYRYLAHLRTREMLELSFEGHRGVLEAIAAGRPALARRRAARLIRGAHAVIARALAEAYPAGGSDESEVPPVPAAPDRAGAAARIRPVRRAGPVLASLGSGESRTCRVQGREP